MRDVKIDYGTILRNLLYLYHKNGLYFSLYSKTSRWETELDRAKSKILIGEDKHNENCTH